MDDLLTPESGDDPNSPRPGYSAVECPACSTEYIKPSATATTLAMGTRTHLGGTFCSTCMGHHWVWIRKPLFA